MGSAERKFAMIHDSKTETTHAGINETETMTIDRQQFYT
jgi:hypothetical protein